MASPYNLFLFTLIPLTFLSINNFNPEAANSPGLINSICSEALNASNCVEYLELIYRPGESLLDLSEHTINTSSRVLFLFHDQVRFREIEASITNPVLSQIYKKCGVAYIAAKNYLKQGQNILKFRDYRKLLSIASAALSQAQSCDRNFTPENPEPSDFKTLAGNAQNVCSIVVVLSKRLASGKPSDF